MDYKLYESVYELNSIIAEVNSQFIYESVELVPYGYNERKHNAIDVDYKETGTKSKFVEKKKTMIEKVKAAWKSFVAMMKKMMKACIEFIKKNVKMIKASFDISVFVEDRRDLLNALRELNHDTKTGVVYNNLANNPDALNDYYLTKNKKGANFIKLKKGEAVKFLEKQLDEANKLIEEFDKEVDKLVSEFEKHKDGMVDMVAKQIGYKVQSINFARNRYKELISEIVDDIQKLSTKKRDMTEKEDK